MKPIVTERLLLRRWQLSDLELFAAINRDSVVMALMPKLLSVDETRADIEKKNTHIDKHGFGRYACVLQETGELIGAVGINIPDFEAHFTPCVEIGWRLSAKHWGKGYATEAAKAVLKNGFEEHGLKKIVSFTVPHNVRSLRIMEKLGMKRDETGDFHHPLLPHDHPLSLHVLYRITKEDWLKNKL